MRVLVIEDERGIADFVDRALSSQGYTVSHAGDGLEGERLALTTDVDLVVLDGRLPGRDGLDVLRAIRAAKSALPVIMLTARGEVADRVAGLDAGATDYLAKPFAVEELLARVRAHLRLPTQSEPTRLEFAEIEMDLLTRAVTRRDHEVHLSAKEFDLLAYFLRHPNQVLSRAQLLGGVWGYEHDPQTNIVEVYVGYLRRKLATGDDSDPIETVRSVGYRLVAR
ncbi:MAG: two-component system, OmpR family, response regulator [Thermoleophilaceae bacterium]|jgi:DNA-binding response OmpR family regulator|nr:two-component system, OmpR family, response regulator [Thermoleophilaceae bacterium]